MKEIPLGRVRRCKYTGRYVALIDDVDYEWASQYNWTADLSRGGQRVYAVRKKLCEDGVKRKVYMHREIWERAHGSLPTHLSIDHKEHGDVSGLDNRRTNLRLADCTLNAANQRRRRDNTSGYKGVSFCKHIGKWAAYINRDGRRFPLGLFLSASEAATAYDSAATKLYGDYSLRNAE